MDDRVTINQYTIARLLRRARRDILSLKNKQFAGGDNLAFVVNTTASTYDRALTVANFGESSIYCEFKGTKQKHSIADFGFRVYTNAAATNETLPGDSDYPLLSPIRNRFFGTGGTLDTRSKWDISVSNFSGSSKTWYFKYYVQSTDTGIVSASALPI